MKNKNTIYTKLNYKLFSYKVFISFLLLVITQLIFFLINREHFDLSNESSLRLILGNTIYILSTLSIYLCIFILLSTFPVISLRNLNLKSIYHKLNFVFWIVPTFLMVFLNLVDVFWYSTVGARSTYSQMSIALKIESKFQFVISIIKTEFLSLILLFGTFILVVILCKKIDRFFCKDIGSFNYKQDKYLYIYQSVLFLLVVGFSFFCYRGVYKGKNNGVLRPVHALTFSNLTNIDLVVNTPYLLSRTINKENSVLNVNFYTPQVAHQLFNIERTFPTHNENLLPGLKCLKYSGIKNIVILQVESLSAEYVHTYNPESNYTPFIDSLIEKSVSYLGWANGKYTWMAPHSINSSIPAYDGNKITLRWPNAQNPRTDLESPNVNSDLLPKSYNGILTVYSSSTNSNISLSQILKDRGFNTLFFFGDINGSFSLDAYSKQTGFDLFYGKSEYDRDNPNNKDYLEGSWGLLDEPFLQYSANQIDKVYQQTRKPFYGYIITGSSHHPFLLPDKFKNTLPDGPLPIHKTIAYADYSIKQFFNSISTKEWFKDTLFIILADHTGRTSIGGVWSKPKGDHMIPIIFYTPGSGCISDNSSNMLVSQVDIFPTILDILGINIQISAYGRSIFDPDHENIGLTSSGVTHIFMKDNYLVQCIEYCLKIEVYDVIKDPMNNNDLMKNIESIPDKEKKIILDIIDRTKASIQVFSSNLNGKAPLE